MNKKQKTPAYKIILIGDSRVGKTSLLNQLTTRQKPNNTKNYPPTIGVQYSTKYIRSRNTNRQFKSQIWDTSGAQKYQSITSSYYRKSQGAILVFDVTQRKSFENIVKWLDNLRKFSIKDIIIVLIANKIDLVESGEKQRMVSEAQITQFCLVHELTFKQTSAITGYNVTQLFEQMLEKIQETASNNNYFEENSQIKNSFTSEPNKRPSEHISLIKIEEQQQDTKCPKCC